MALALVFALLASADTLVTRFAPPAGVARIETAPDSFGAFLRALPLAPVGTPVRLFDGRDKGRQDVHAAVFEVDVGTRDLQQCADATIRLFAEYLWSKGRANEVCFRATSGDALAFAEWQHGMRPVLNGSRLRLAPWSAPDASHKSFRRYLDAVFTYAGTRSLARDLTPVPLSDLAIGDIFLQAGSPGHAVIVVDLAEARDGRRYVLLAQSYMPAQSIHVLTNPRAKGPWYELGRGEALVTPEWTFEWESVFRFSAGCR